MDLFYRHLGIVGVNLVVLFLKTVVMVYSINFVLGFDLIQKDAIHLIVIMVMIWTVTGNITVIVADRE